VITDISRLSVNTSYQLVKRLARKTSLRLLKKLTQLLKNRKKVKESGLLTSLNTIATKTQKQFTKPKRTIKQIKQKTTNLRSLEVSSQCYCIFLAKKIINFSTCRPLTIYQTFIYITIFREVGFK
jgi:hypothetical protein